MAKNKLSGSIWGVLGDGVKLYCVHFKQFALYMLFPVLGQMAGLFWVFATSYLFSKNLDYLTREIPALDSFGTIMISLMLITLPGLILWMKAFWETGDRNDDAKPERETPVSGKTRKLTKDLKAGEKVLRPTFPPPP